MKEMEYFNERLNSPILLTEGFYKGYKYYILNLGSFPTAYVEVPRGHPDWFKDFDEVPILCNWGLTYGRNYLRGFNSGEWTIGWDYAHCTDYMGGDEDTRNLKKWTTREIFEEVKDVINQLIKRNKEL